MFGLAVITDARQPVEQMNAFVAAIPILMDDASMSAAGVAVQVLRPAIAKETPVDTGALEASTGGEAYGAPNGSAFALITQPAQNREGIYYGQLLIHGFDHYFWGTFVRHREPDDYPGRAIEATLGVLQDRIAFATNFAIKAMRF